MELVKFRSPLLFLSSKWGPVILFGLGVSGFVLAILTFNQGTMVLPPSSPSSLSSSVPLLGVPEGSSPSRLADHIWALLFPSSLHSHLSPEYACTPDATQLASLLPKEAFTWPSNSFTNLQQSFGGEYDKFSPIVTGKSLVSKHASVMTSSTASDTTCDMYSGQWVEDDTYPLYTPDSCPFVDKKFNCQQNDRHDTKYTRWRWAPRDCPMPRFSGKQMLETLRGKRLAFVGDSLNRNQWESMLCMLRESLANKSRIARQHGSNRILKFLDYNCTVEFHKSRYLVDMNEGSSETNYRIRLDTMDKTEIKWRGANILVFNTAHWWGPGKLGKGENRFQEGDNVHTKLDVMVAYKHALLTWAKWVDRHVDPHETRVFFRTYSPQHFRGGQWNSGGHCEDEMEPAYDDSNLPTYPNEMRALEEVLGLLKVPVHVLDVTKLSAYRKDAHPSVYWHPQQFNVPQQDCGHWCLPGVPDTWNELLYYSLTTSP